MVPAKVVRARVMNLPRQTRSDKAGPHRTSSYYKLYLKNNRMPMMGVMGTMIKLKRSLSLKLEDTLEGGKN